MPDTEDAAAALPGSDASAVDVALRPLDRLTAQPVAEHVAVFNAVHRALQDTLATLDQA